MTMKAYQHWRLQVDQDNGAQIIWAYFDRSDASTNSINHKSLEELDDIVTMIQSNTACVGFIIASAKENGFIAGADISQISNFDTTEDAIEFIRYGQTVFHKIEALTIPTVAMIKGFCMGGGCELALACRYRVACDDDTTRIGLPEVKLGIQPGWGGTVRLPKLVGVFSAMDMMLSGRPIRSRAAEKMNLVDAAVPLRQLKRAALFYIHNKPESKPASFLKYDLLTMTPVRQIVAEVLARQVSKKARPEHYPAPFQMIDNFKNATGDESEAYRVELDGIINLMNSGTVSRNLFRVFSLQEQLKTLGNKSDFSGKRVHVIGAGVMGGDIAAWCALQGFTVTLQDRAPEFIAPAIQRASKLYQKKLKQPRLVNAALDRLIPDVDGIGITTADVIIEAIFENLEAKQALFKKLEKEAKSTAILATNTSSIPLNEISSSLQDPARLIGIHFFNPVAQMPLVEIVEDTLTRAEVSRQAKAFVRHIDKLPLPVKSSPGFLVNRVLMPYLMECMQLVEEGVPPGLIDEAALSFGMPMGPVELADTVGLDVCLSVAENLSSHFGGNIPDELRTMVSNKQLGRKTGKGFYEYKKGKPIKPAYTKNDNQLQQAQDRLVMRMVNEAVACLNEGVVENADLLDAGMIFGTGFAPFRGGPMHYAQERGLQVLSELNQNLIVQYGKRFELRSTSQEIYTRDHS